MERYEAQSIIKYYANIPEMMKFERKLIKKIEAEHYDILRGVNMDGMPHGSSTGDPTSKAGIKAADNNISDRIGTAKVRLSILEKDRATIEKAISYLNYSYKDILLRKGNNHTWGSIALEMELPESTARHIYNKAIIKIGDILAKEDPNISDMIERAHRATK